MLNLHGLRNCEGVIRDLAYIGSLFVPRQPIAAREGQRGTLRFPLPTSSDWLEPQVEIRRFTTFTRAGGEPGQGIGLEFAGLTAAQEKAIAEGCQQWDGQRMRQYELSARVYVQGEGGLTHYTRFGRLIAGTRTYLRLRLPSGPGLARGIHLRLKLARSWVSGEVEQLSQQAGEIEVLLRLEGWGRDFFLHEARRQPPA